MRQLQRRQEAPSLIEGLLRRLRELTGAGYDEGGLRATIEELIEESGGGGAPGGRLTESERVLLLNALAFGELEVADIMIPRADIRAVEVGTSLQGVIETMILAKHSRLPVYRETLDDVIGAVHVKDLLPFWKNPEGFELSAVARRMLVVPPSMVVVDLLREMRDTGVHMAVVVDEFGGTDGLVTIEDVVQEIVGEIHDEDRGAPPSSMLVRRDDGTIDVQGRIDLEELERELGLKLLDEDSEDEVDTLGGLIFMMLDRVPAKGERVAHPSGLEFEMLDADPRRIKRVRIHGARGPDGDRGEG